MTRGAGVPARQAPLLPADTAGYRPPQATGRTLLPEVPKVLRRGHDLDARLRKPHLTSDGTLERMFCISCGAPSGWVTAEVVSIATYVCLSCTAANGSLPLPRLDIPE